MSQSELLAKVVQALDSCQIDYMVTGSFASSLQGVPRATHDIDLVVAISRTAADKFSTLFASPEYYLEKAAIYAAIDARSMFNLMSVSEGDKVDFWMLTETPFDQSRFARRRVETFETTQVHVSTPEDTILAKLHWARESGGSEKQFDDALRVYELQHEQLDSKYLEHWV